MQPRLGYLCLFENPTVEAGRALIRQFVLVREADRMGFDDIWLAEHHHDDLWVSPASTVLLGHLAGVTSKARIGLAPLLAGVRDPLQLAEDIAVADLLSKGRLQLAFGAGGPFEPLYRHAGLSRAEVEERAAEALALIGRLLGGERVSFQGRHFQADALELVPAPAQQPVPCWLSGHADTTVSRAAQMGFGLMGAATWTLARLQRMRAGYRAHAPGTDPKLVLARFCSVAKSRNEALEIAQPYFDGFVARMRALGLSAPPGESAALDAQALLEQSLVGNYDEVAEQIRALHRQTGVWSLALIPTSAQFDTVKHCLAALVDEIRPRLDED